ncbi:hypothetical protein ACFX19_043230 [Malus domestica]
MWWSQTIPPSLLALPTQSFHLDRWGHPPRQAKLKDGLKSLLRNCTRSIRLLHKSANRKGGKAAIGSATDAHWRCSVAVQRVCSGCAQWLGSVAVLWVLTGSDIKVTSTYSVSCLAAANDFNDRRQTTSRS